MPSVAVVVPVLNRPERAAIFVPSLSLSVVGSTAIAWMQLLPVCETSADYNAWDVEGVRPIWAGQGAHTFAEKCNLAVRRSTTPEPDWYFFVGDDVRFQAGWLDEALRVAAETGAQVVGTNDLGNPHVMAGERGTHNLISRRYIMERGACGDGPGTVYSEAYRHCCDVETVEVAKVRGVWASAHDSIVEHCHPTWGKGEMDDTYREGMRHQVRDWQTWMDRQEWVLEWANNT